MIYDIPRFNSPINQSVLSLVSAWVHDLPVESAELARLDTVHPETFSWHDLYEFLVNLIAEAEQSTPGHSQRVAELSLRCGVALELKPHELRLLYWGGALHDLGKLGVQSQGMVVRV